MQPTPLIHTVGRLVAAIGVLIGLLLLLGTGTAAAEDAVAPTVTLHANGPGWITITFVHPGTDGLLWYYPEREGGGGTYTMGAPNQFIDTHLTPDTEYAYRVCAVYEEEEPLCSDFQPERTLPAPGRPANFDPPTITDIEVASDAIKVTWGPTGDYTQILVHLSDTLGNVDQREVQNVPNGSFLFPGLRPGALYRVILKGCSFSLNNGCGPWSPDVFITTPPLPQESPPPGKPTIKLTGQTPTTVSLDFFVKTRVVTPGQRFLVYRDGVQLAPVTPKAALNGYAGSYTDAVQTFARHHYHVCFEEYAHHVCSDSVSPTPAVDIEPRIPARTCHLLPEGCDAASPDLPYGPDTCKQGYVWREAFEGDTVCVTPDRRTQVAADNVEASARREPNGGAYGPDTCISGYVWRVARPSDLVCVTPAERSLVAAENATANERRVVPR